MSQNPPDNIIPFQNEGCSDGVPPPRFTPVPFEQFASLEDTEWLIHNFIPKHELVVIYGASGSGKSFLTFELLMTIARGLPWYGENTEPIEVIYITAENPSSFKKRSYAYKQRHNLRPEDTANFRFIEDCPNLLDTQDAPAIAAMVGNAGIIAIDTFARVIPGADENSAQDIGKAITQCQILAKLTNALIILVHHTGHNTERARGSSALKAAVDTEISVEKKGAVHIATITKQRDGPVGTKYPFTLEFYPLGKDKRENEIGTCIFKAEDPASVKAQPEKRSYGLWEQRIIDAFEAMHMPTMRPEIPQEDLIQRVISNVTQDPNKDDRRRDCAFRALNGLIQKKELILNGSLIGKT